ncbi:MULTISPECIES: prephenate dehydrogenase [Clostridium]|uniref:prephenate dehydrogenase n=1 Tax=Clostridium TaxID=1485 RepID=UPI00082609C6|nr:MULTISPECIES: prephenate dehydrogenase [Clostridium]PJI07444.1 prephenate dehydrogenase/arogenate dehydrogenase family protein [Clostridium sp. CT7]
MDDGDFKINLTIVGLGLIGGSYAMAFRKVNKGRIWAIDLNENTLKKAAKKDIIDEGYSMNNAYIPLKKSDIVIIAIYPEALIEFVKSNVSNFKKGSIITDVLGIKGKNIDYIQNILGNDAEFLGGHPMAGKELSGFDNADGAIFKNANYILTPTSKNKRETIDAMRKFVRAIGFKDITEVTPERHDEIIALTSQLPHVIAVSLMNSSYVDSSIKHFIGGSFRDATRVARINPDLWCQLFTKNKDNLLKVINDFEDSIDELKKAIEEGHTDNIKRILEKASSKKDGII